MLEQAISSIVAKSSQIEGDTNAGVQNEKAQLEAQWRALEEERKKFTDAAIKLGLERANIQVGF